jgi:serine/threonine protein kinase
VADLFEGLTLKNLVIEFGPLEEQTAKIYLRQLLLAVHQLHHEHQTHNRINMDNIFHDKMGNVLLNNFKSSKHPLSETEKSLYLYYFPPETLLSRNNMSSEKNDIWSIGCVTLQMLVPKSIKLSKYHPYNKNITAKSLNESTIILDKIQTIVQSKY